MSDMKNYSKQEMITQILILQELFEVARLVDVTMTFQLALNDTCDDLVETVYDCYAVWNKGHRCENCVSAMAFRKKNKTTKFEFIDNDVYYVVAKYVEVETKPYILELVTKVNDETLFGAYGKDNIVNTITSFNKKLYVDPLTKAYNRNYYDTQLVGLSKTKAVAMMDIDHFKTVNDTYGHATGDLVLQKVIGTILSHVRTSDSVIRYGGDEFLIMFNDIKEEFLKTKLEELRKSVEELTFEDYPDLKTSISIGGVFCETCDKSVVAAADERLYAAKKQRNCSVCD